MHCPLMPARNQFWLRPGEMCGACLIPDSLARSELVAQALLEAKRFPATSRRSGSLRARARMKSNWQGTARTRLELVRTVLQALKQVQGSVGRAVR